MGLDAPTQPEEWNAVLDSLPDTPEKIPAFFIAHGHPGWIWPSHLPERFGSVDNTPRGRPVAFLKDFGRAVVKKYKPKGILVFSAHWETHGERLVTDYGDRNPLLYDYYNFDKSLYTDVDFKSKGDSALSKRVVDAFKDAGLKARTTPVTEPRGRDGRGFMGRNIMFPGHGREAHSTVFDIPVVQASIEEEPSPADNEAIGKAVSKLREEGILILTGGLTVHTFNDRSAFDENTAKDIYKQWDAAVLDAVRVPKTPETKRQAIYDLVKHPGCHLAHPTLEHFLPLYVALGAGTGGDAKVLSGLYGANSFVFGL